jgi:hypothetical protein
MEERKAQVAVKDKEKEMKAEKEEERQVRNLYLDNSTDPLRDRD